MMGMYDSFIDASGTEWQTKAFDCQLGRYSIGAPVPPVHAHFRGELAEGLPMFRRYQVVVMGDGGSIECATVQDGHLASVPAEREHHVPLVGYSGGIISKDPQPEITDEMIDRAARAAYNNVALYGAYRA